jgi:hypothetical protein
MSPSTEKLDRKACQALAELIDVLNNEGVVANLYPSLLMESVESLGADPQPPSDEVACFGAFCIAVNSTQYIRRHRFLLGNEPDKAGAKVFSNSLFEHLGPALNSRPSREAFNFYLEYEDPNFTGSHPFSALASVPPAHEEFQARFIDYKFKVHIFTTRLAKIIYHSVPAARRHAVYSIDLLPLGRQMAEATADISKETFRS